MPSAYATLIEGAGYNTVGYWPMNDASGSTLVADVGTNGTYDGSPTLGGAGGVAGESPNTCASYNGSSQAAQAAINLSTYATITVCFWLYIPSTVNTSVQTVGVEDTTNFNNTTNAFFFSPYASTTQHRSMIHGGTGYNGGLFTAPSTNAWHFFACIYDLTAGTGLATPVYVDGASVSVSQDFSTAPSGNFPNSTLYFMSRGDASLWTGGKMQDVSVHSSALTSGQISSMYSTGTGGGGTTNVNAPAAQLRVWSRRAPTVAAGTVIAAPSAQIRLRGVPPGIVTTAAITPPSAQIRWQASRGGSVSISVVPPSGQLRFRTGIPSAVVGTVVTPPSAQVRLRANAPSVIGSAGILARSGQLRFRAVAPTITTDTILTPRSAQLRMWSFGRESISGSATITLGASAQLRFRAGIATVTVTSPNVNVTPPSAQVRFWTSIPTVAAGVPAPDICLPTMAFLVGTATSAGLVGSATGAALPGSDTGVSVLGSDTLATFDSGDTAVAIVGSDTAAALPGSDTGADFGEC